MAPIPLPLPLPLPSITLESAATAISHLTTRLPAELSGALLVRDPTPTPTTAASSSIWSRILHATRSTSSIIPAGYGNINNSLPPGTVVGIVIGSVAGFLLILWLIYTCLNFTGGYSGSTYTESVVVQRDHKRRSRHSGSHRSRRAPSETIEIRTHQSVRPPSRSPIRIVRSPSPPPPLRTERIIVEEHRETRRAPSRRDSDEVVVIEEHSPPRRKKSHREREAREERDSGFRTVDPLAYGGVVGGNSRRGSRRRDG